MVKVGDSIFHLSINQDYSAGFLLRVEELSVISVVGVKNPELCLGDKTNSSKIRIDESFLNILPKEDCVRLRSSFFYTSLSLLDEGISSCFEGLTYYLKNRVQSFENEIISFEGLLSSYFNKHSLFSTDILLNIRTLLACEDVNWDYEGELSLFFDLSFSESDFNEDYISLSILPVTAKIVSISEMQEEIEEYPDYTLYQEALSEPSKKVLKAYHYYFQKIESELGGCNTANYDDYHEFFVLENNIRILDHTFLRNSYHIQKYLPIQPSLSEKQLEQECSNAIKSMSHLFEEKYFFFKKALDLIKDKTAYQVLEQHYFD